MVCLGASVCSTEAGPPCQQFWELDVRPWARLSQPLVPLILKETNPESSLGTQDLGEGELSVAKVDQLSPGKESQRTRTQERGLLSLWGLATPPQSSQLSLQADSSLLFPVPACAPGPGEFRHPGLRLKLHSRPGAEPVSVAWSQRAGTRQWGVAGWLVLGDADP